MKWMAAEMCSIDGFKMDGCGDVFDRWFQNGWLRRCVRSMVSKWMAAEMCSIDGFKNEVDGK
jgi:hypothetical protein